MTDHTATFCGSNHLTSFGGSFVVPMNSIDLGDSAFLKLHENPVVFATMVAIMALYLIMVIWARKMDMFDAVKVGVVSKYFVCKQIRCLYDRSLAH